MGKNLWAPLKYSLLLGGLCFIVGFAGYALTKHEAFNYVATLGLVLYGWFPVAALGFQCYEMLRKYLNKKPPHDR